VFDVFAMLVDPVFSFDFYFWWLCFREDSGYFCCSYDLGFWL